MRTIRDSERREIWWGTALVAVVYVSLIVLAYWRLRYLGAQPPVRALVIAFFSVQMLIVFVLSLRALWTKGWDELSERYHGSLRPRILEALSRCASGKPSADLWDRVQRRAPGEFEKQWLHAVSTLDGPARQRLTEAAHDSGMHEQWWNALADPERPSRLRAVEGLAATGDQATADRLLPLLYDVDPSVQVLAGSALLDSGAPEPVARVYRRALEGSPLLRLLLEPKLSSYASHLCRYVLPVLSPDLTATQWRAALKLARVWRQELSPQLLAEACRHPDAAVRRAALALSTEQDPADTVRSRLEFALGDPEPEVRRSAASLAGATRILSLIPALARELDSDIPENSITAATALASLGTPGEPVLRRRLTHGAELPRQSAMEALSRKQLGRPLAVCG